MKINHVLPKIGKLFAIRTIFAIASLSATYAALSTTPPPKVDVAIPPGAEVPASTTATSTESSLVPSNANTRMQQALMANFEGDVDRIDPQSGIMHQSYNDLSIPGNGGFDLSILRTYSSAHTPNLSSAMSSHVGLGWRIEFGKIIVKRQYYRDIDAIKLDNPHPCALTRANEPDTSRNPILALPAQGYQTLAYTPERPSITMLAGDSTIVTCKPGGMSVLTPNGLRYDMTEKIQADVNHELLPLGEISHANIWIPSRITDRNGNYITFSYARPGTSIVTQIVTNDGRVVNFEYYDEDQPWARIKKISSGRQSIQYEYQAISGAENFHAYQLHKAVRDDGTFFEYDYHPLAASNKTDRCQMKSVINPFGGRTEYFYVGINFPSRKLRDASFISYRVKYPINQPPAMWMYRYNEKPFYKEEKDFSEIERILDFTVEIGPTARTIYMFFPPLPGAQYSFGLLKYKYITSRNHEEPPVFYKKEEFGWRFDKMNDQRTRGDEGYFSHHINAHKIEQDGAIFYTAYQDFDEYKNAKKIIETGFDASLGVSTSRTTINEYYLFKNAEFLDVRKIKSSSSNGNSLVNEYDGNGNLKSMSKNGVTTIFKYDANFLLERITTPDGLFHYYKDYKRGIPQEESHPEDVYISRTVDDAGNILTETNGERHTTVSTYDGLNRVRTIQQPLGALKIIEYTANQKTVTHGNSYEITDFDGFGRPVTTNTNGVITTIGYDAIGRKNFVSNPGSNKGTSFIYDELNRLKRTENIDGSVSTIEYGKGNVTTTNERRQGSYRYDYRSYGNPSEQILMAIIAPETASSINIGRKPNDLIETVTQDGITRSYTYYPNNYLETVTHPETGQTVFGRDAMGNMTTKTVAGGSATIFTYDGQNRLETITYPDNTPAVTYRYSKTGKLKFAITSNNVRGFIYDENDNLKEESLSIDGLNFTTGYEYDATNALKNMTLPRSAKTIHYAPDAFGRATQVSGYINNVTYWPSGQVRQMDYNNGLNVNFGQNSRLWPETLSAQKDGRTLMASSYKYDGVGNLETAMDSVEPSFNRIMEYDQIDRVTTTNGSWGNGSVVYDGRGNISNQYINGFGLNYEYDKGSNRLASVSGYRAASFGYDRNGNIIGGFDQYTYNEASQLTCINCTVPAKKIEYRYDGQGQRVAVTKAGVTTYEIYSAAGKLLLEFTPSLNNKMVEHIYLNSKRIAQRVLNQ